MADISPGRLRLGRSLAAVLIAVALNVCSRSASTRSSTSPRSIRPGTADAGDERQSARAFPTGWSSPSSPAWSRFASPATRPGATLWRSARSASCWGRWARLPPPPAAPISGPTGIPGRLAASAIPCTWLAWVIARRRISVPNLKPAGALELLAGEGLGEQHAGPVVLHPAHHATMLAAVGEMELVAIPARKQPSWLKRPRAARGLWRRIECIPLSQKAMARMLTGSRSGR